MPVAVKRVYAKPVQADGARVLVDRLWPRGVRKQSAAVHAWLRDLAPSESLRQWFHAHPDGWAVFRKRYLRELASPSVTHPLEELHRLADRRKKLTLLFSSRDETHNNAVVLKDLLDGMRKPPTGTGPAGAAAIRQSRRMAR